MLNYLSAGIAYIEENGDEFERARLAGLLGRAQPESKIVRTMSIRQNEDGGYPYDMIPGRPSAITSTVTGLQWMDDLRLIPQGGPFVDRAVGYLLSTHRPDGAWDESPAVLKYNPPTYSRPGSKGARLHCTALVTYWLARLVGPSHDTVVRGAKYLADQRGGGWPGDVPVETVVEIVAAAAIVGGTMTSIATEGLKVLSQEAPEVWTAEVLAEMLSAFACTSLTRNHALVASSVERLRAQQRADGGWTCRRSVDLEVDLSLRALRALLALGVSAPQEQVGVSPASSVS